MWRTMAARNGHCTSYTSSSLSFFLTTTPGLREMPSARKCFLLSSRSRKFRRSYASFDPPSLSTFSPTAEPIDKSSDAGIDHSEKSGYSMTNEVHTSSREDKKTAKLKVYAQWTVYRTKTALRFAPQAPIMTEKPSYTYQSKPGSFQLVFADSDGPRSYDWANRIIFALSANELGSILASPDTEHVLIHDPGMMTKNQSTIIKRLKISRTADNTVLFNVKTQHKKDENQNRDLSIFLSPGEFEVFKTLSEFLIPRFLAFDKVF